MSTHPTIAHLLGEWLEEPSMANVLTSARQLDAVPAQYASIPPNLDPRLLRALGVAGIEQLYSHQREAIDAAVRGEKNASIGQNICATGCEETTA